MPVRIGWRPGTLSIRRKPDHVPFCGGCGKVQTTADARFFLDLWLDDPSNRTRLLEPGATHLGFALRAGGDGRKAAVLVLGRTS